MLKAFITLATLSLISFTSPEANPSNMNEAVVTDAKHNLVVTNNATMSFAEKQAAFDGHLQQIYNTAGLRKAGLDLEVFRKAYIGFQNLKEQGLVSSEKSILTVVDFTKHSNTKRLWSIDLEAGKVLMNSLVAHGRNTGEAKALKFSNQPNSYMSSLGFYVTDKTYFGKHGLSLRLKGVDEGFNTNAMERAIVMHGADYATEAFVKQYGRLGRSLGCPAVPRELSKQLIETVKDETVLYIHGSDTSYKSAYLNEVAVIEKFAMNLSETSQFESATAI